MKLSVIIPVYKAEKYIERCVCSVLAQTFADLELIAVVDGSPDDSLAICERLAVADGRMVVISQDNKGAHAARLNGLQHSSAPYITFVDADDWLPKDALECLYDEIVQGYDIVKGHEDVKRGDRYGLLGDKLEMTGREFMERVFIGDIGVFMWGTLFRREVLSEDCFRICIDNGISISEDWVTNLCVGKNVCKALWVNRVVYHYEMNPDSMMNTCILSDMYGRKVAGVVDDIIGVKDERWQYLSLLKAASGISYLFVPLRPYEHSIYMSFRMFVERYGMDPLRPYVDVRHTRFIMCEPLFRMYAWLYRTVKLFVRYRCRAKRLQ